MVGSSTTTTQPGQVMEEEVHPLHEILEEAEALARDVRVLSQGKLSLVATRKLIGPVTWDEAHDLVEKEIVE